MYITDGYYIRSINLARRKSLRDSYILAFAGFLGFAGLHRFYLGKPFSGFLWFITGGLAGLGTIYDLLTLPEQVEQVNRRRELEYRLDAEDYTRTAHISGSYASDAAYRNAGPEPRRERPQARSLEHLALILAEENQGILTAAQLALESGVAADKARDELEQMVIKGFAWPGQRKSGLSVYVFQEFLTDSMRSELIF
jgi:hypothetical protein